MVGGSELAPVIVSCSGPVPSQTALTLQFELEPPRLSSKNAVPTSIVVAWDGGCSTWNPRKRKLSLSATFRKLS